MDLGPPRTLRLPISLSDLHCTLLLLSLDPGGELCVLDLGPPALVLLEGVHRERRCGEGRLLEVASARERGAVRLRTGRGLRPGIVPGRGPCLDPGGGALQRGRRGLTERCEVVARPCRRLLLLDQYEEESRCTRDGDNDPTDNVRRMSISSLMNSPNDFFTRPNVSHRIQRSAHRVRDLIAFSGATIARRPAPRANSL
jgi:hypothetical protein